MGATIYTAYRNYTRFYLTWDEGGQDIANNRTRIHWSVGVQAQPGWSPYWGLNAIRLNSAYIDGQGNLASGTWSNITIPSGGRVPLRSGSIWVGHSSNGTKGFNATVHGWFFGNGDVTADGYWNIATIPRNSQVTTNASSLYHLDTPLTIYTNRKSSSFDHLIRIRQSGSNALIREIDNVQSSTVFTPSAANITQMQNLIPNDNRIRLLIQQYNRQVGQWSDISIWAYVRNANPEYSNFTYRDSNSLVTSVTENDQILVKGLSTLETTIAEADKMVAIKGANPSRYSLVYDGVTRQETYVASGNVVTTFPPSQTIGQNTIIATALDTRNNNTSVSKQVTVLDYTAPSIESSITRENNFGTDTTIHMEGRWTPLVVDGEIKNAIVAGSLKYRFREAEGAFSAWVPVNFTVDQDTWTLTTDFVLSLDNTKKYDFEFQVADKFQVITATRSVDVGKPILFVGESDGEPAIGVGKMPEQGALDVAGDIYSNGNKIIVGGWDEIARYSGAIGTTATTITFPSYKYIRVVASSRQTGTQTAQCVFRIQGNGITSTTGHYRATTRVTSASTTALSVGDTDSIIMGISRGLHQQSLGEVNLTGLGSSTINSIGYWTLSTDDQDWLGCSGKYLVRNSTNLTSFRMYATGTTYSVELVVYGHN